MVFAIASFRLRSDGNKSTRSDLIKCTELLSNHSLLSANYLLSTLPFFNVCKRDESPFSFLKVKHTSSRKSRAISSFTRCSLMSMSKTVGGTEPLAMGTNQEQKTKTNQTRNLANRMNVGARAFSRVVEKICNNESIGTNASSVLFPASLFYPDWLEQILD